MNQNIIFNFETTALRDKFLTWWTAQGGDQEFHTALEYTGEGSFLDKVNHEEFVVDMYEYTVERDENGDYDNLPKPKRT